MEAATVVRTVREEKKLVERRSGKRKSQRKRKHQKKEDQSAQKGRKVVKHVVFPMCCGSGGSKSWLAKRSKKITRLWREAHLEVKMLKTPRVRSTFGRSAVKKCRRLWREAAFQILENISGSEHFWELSYWRNAKAHAAAAPSRFRSENVKNNSASELFWKLSCSKSARGCCTKHISKPKWWKHHMFAPLLKSARGCGAKHLLKSNVLKIDGLGPLFILFEVRMRLCMAGAMDSTPRKQWAKRVWFCGSFKNDGRRGTLEEELQRCISCGRHNTREISIRVGRPGPWFHETVAFWSIGSSGLLRWFCVTGAALRMTWPPSFVASAILWSSGMGKSQNALARGHQLCTQLSCIFDVAPFQTWGSLTFFFVLDLRTSNFWGCLAKVLRLGPVNFHFWRMSS